MLEKTHPGMQSYLVGGDDPRWDFASEFCQESLIIGRRMREIAEGGQVPLGSIIKVEQSEKRLLTSQDLPLMRAIDHLLGKVIDLTVDLRRSEANKLPINRRR